MAQQNNQHASTLKPHQVRRVFRLHRGAQTRLAERLGVSRSHVSKWLSGSAVSSRIAAEATAMVFEFQEAKLAA